MTARLIAILLTAILQFLQTHLRAQAPDALATRIDTFLCNSVPNGFSGSVLIAKDGKIILSKGYGWADLQLEIPNSPTTVFNIGSVTKQFTAAAILKLQEAGKLNTTDKLVEWFPEAPLDKQQISIHQLLTHTSGVSPATGGFRYDEASKPRFLNEFFGSELLYPPGTRHTYANANYILLAAIVEIASGLEYESFLREYFWKPLHMNHTGYKSVVLPPEVFAHGYYYHHTEGQWKDWGTTREHLPGNKNHWYSIGKGDLYSTVEDLYSWHRALEQNEVLQEASRRIMETPHIPENDAQTSYYGYGWAIYRSSRDTKIVTHNGSNAIYFADFLRFVEDDMVIIALSNVRLNRQSENVGWEIAGMVLNPAYKPQTIPKNTYALVFDFIRGHSPEMAPQLPDFIENNTGSALNDKAILNRIGYKQVTENLETDWGIALLKLNTSLFPQDGNLWDSLGEGYYLLGDGAKAKESFKKALELGAGRECPWCANSRDKLDRLQGR